MYPWRRILVPTDFSTAAKWAFDAAIREAAHTGAEIVILHVRIPHSGELHFDSSVYEYVEQHELGILRKHAHAAHADVPTRLIVRVNEDPAAAIIECARQEEVDLVVLATHARHHVAHLLIGSTTLRVLGSSPVPVLAIRYGVKERERIDRIAIVGDSEGASDVAARIAAREGAQIVLDADGDGLDAALVVMARDATPEGTLARSGEEIVRHAEAPVLVVPPA